VIAAFSHLPVKVAGAGDAGGMCTVAAAHTPA